MRRETPENQQHHSSCYGTGTRVEVHRSRHELEHVLHKYGADEVLFVEADANASIQFAMHGRYVQLALPLPDPHDARFTHTPSGKPRALSAQERAYDQALREHWRSLIVAVRGKLQSVESGISTFEQEFDRFLVPHFAEEKKKRQRKAPKAVNWLLGGSHSLAIALVAAFLVPASAVGAFALPTDVVGHLSAPFRSAVVESTAADHAGSGIALARGGWAPSSGKIDAPSSHSARLSALRSRIVDGSGQVRQEASLSTPPPTDGGDAPGPQPEPQSSHTTPPSNDAPSSPPSPPARGDGGGQQPAHSDPPPVADTPAPTPSPADGGDSTPTDTQSGDPGEQPSAPVEGAPDDASVSDPAADGTSPDSQPSVDGAGDAAPPSPDAGDPNNAPGNGNGNGNGNANGQNGTQGQGNGQGNAQGNAAPGDGNGNGNGNANGQNGTQGQGNGKGKGGK